MGHLMNLNGTADAEVTQLLHAVGTPLSRQGIRVQGPAQSGASSAVIESASSEAMAGQDAGSLLHPNTLPAIIVAAILGFLLGYLVGRRTHAHSVKGGHG